jgi:hypothetical protein
VTAEPGRPGHPRTTYRFGALVLLAAVLLAALTGVAAAGTGGGEPSGGGPLPRPEQSPGEVRDTADEVLSRAEFDHEPTIAERIMQWISDRIDDLFSALGGGAGGQAILGWIVLALLLGAVGFLVYRLVRGLDDGRAESPAGGVSVTGGRGGKVDWAKLATEAEADGRWRLGLRCRYRVLTDALVQADVLDDIPGRTSGEHRREVTDRAPQAATPFSQAADLFDRAWYGNRPTGPDESRRFQDLAAEVLQRAARPDRRAVDELDAPLAAPR